MTRVKSAPLIRTVTVNSTLAAKGEVILSLKVTGRLSPTYPAGMPRSD